MILPRTVMANMKKALRAMSKQQLLSLLDQQKLSLSKILANERYSDADAFSYKQKIQLIEDELKQREIQNTQEL